MKPKRNGVIYQRKFKKNALRVQPPFLRHVDKNYVCTNAVVISDGVELVDGEEREFQDLRVYVKRGVISSD